MNRTLIGNGDNRIGVSEIVPHRDHIAVEQAFLVCALLAREASEYKNYLMILDDDDFLNRQNKLMFEALCDYAEKGISPDAVLLSNDYKDLDPVYTAELFGSFALSYNIGEYAKAIKSNSLRRDLIEDIKQEKSTPTNELIEKIQDNISQFQTSLPQDWSLKDAIGDTMDEIEKRITGDIQYSTGLMDLDMVTGGYEGGDCIIVAGRPSHGKTSLAVNNCLHRLREGDKVLYIDLETNYKQMLKRFIGLIAEVEPAKMKTGNLNEDEIYKISLANAELSKYELTINDNASILIPDIHTQAKLLEADFIVVDYIQLMSDGGKAKDDNQRTTKLIKGLKAMAKELDIPVMVVSQLSRESERRVDKRPQLSDLRDSGSLEQVADIVIAMYWEYRYDEMAEYNEIVARVLKQKVGASEDVILGWEPTIMRLKTLSGISSGGYKPYFKNDGNSDSDQEEDGRDD